MWSYLAMRKKLFIFYEGKKSWWISWADLLMLLGFWILLFIISPPGRYHWGTMYADHVLCDATRSCMQTRAKSFIQLTGIGRYGSHFKNSNLELIMMPQKLTYVKLTLVYVICWYLEVRSLYLCQCWPVWYHKVVMSSGITKFIHHVLSITGLRVWSKGTPFN